MTQHDTLMRLRHMRDHAREAVGIARERTRQDLEEHHLLGLALTQLLEIVGEAAAYIPEADRERWPLIPWIDIVGLRNRLIHGYDSVDYDILWVILRDDLPSLIVALDRILEEAP